MSAECFECSQQICILLRQITLEYKESASREAEISVLVVRVLPAFTPARLWTV